MLNIYPPLDNDPKRQENKCIELLVLKSPHKISSGTKICEEKIEWGGSPISVYADKTGNYNCV